MAIFHHLWKVRQSYWNHLYDALGYSMKACKASFIFLMNGLYPDLWEYEGGMIIQEIFTTIENKKRKLQGYL